MKDWLDCYSWNPDLLIDKRPITEASIEPVEPAQRLTTVHESEYSYYDWLYLGSELGGEG
jgi:hypothetical protein